MAQDTNTSLTAETNATESSFLEASSLKAPTEINYIALFDDTGAETNRPKDNSPPITSKTLPDISSESEATEIRSIASLDSPKPGIHELPTSGDINQSNSPDIGQRVDTDDVASLQLDDCDPNLLQVDELGTRPSPQGPLVLTQPKPTDLELTQPIHNQRRSFFEGNFWSDLLSFRSYIEQLNTDPYEDNKGLRRNWSWKHVNKWAIDPLHHYLFRVHNVSKFDLRCEPLNVNSEFLTELATANIHSWEEGFCPREFSIYYRESGRVPLLTGLRRFKIQGNPEHPEYRLWWIVMETFHRMKAAYEMVRSSSSSYREFEAPYDISGTNFEAAAKDFFGVDKYEVTFERPRHGLLQALLDMPHIVQFFVHVTQMNMLEQEADDEGRIDLSRIKHVTAEKVGELHQVSEFRCQLPLLRPMYETAARNYEELKKQLAQNYSTPTVADEDSTLSHDSSATLSTGAELSRMEWTERDAELQGQQATGLENALTEVDLAGIDNSPDLLTKGQRKKLRKKEREKQKKLEKKVAASVVSATKIPPEESIQDGPKFHEAEEIREKQHNEEETLQIAVAKEIENAESQKKKIEDVTILEFVTSKSDPQKTEIQQVTNKKAEPLDQAFTVVTKNKGKRKPAKNVSGTASPAPSANLPATRKIQGVPYPRGNPALDLREASFPRLQKAPEVAEKPAVETQVKNSQQPDIKFDKNKKHEKKKLVTEAKVRGVPEVMKAHALDTRAANPSHPSDTEFSKEQKHANKGSTTIPNVQKYPPVPKKPDPENRGTPSFEASVEHANIPKAAKKVLTTIRMSQGAGDATAKRMAEARKVDSQIPNIDHSSTQRAVTSEPETGMVKAVSNLELPTPPPTRASSQARHKSMDARPEHVEVKNDGMTAAKNRLMQQHPPPSLDEVREQKQTEKKQRRDSLNFIRSRASSRAVSLEKPEVKVEATHLANLVSGLRAQVEQGKESIAVEQTMGLSTNLPLNSRDRRPDKQPAHIPSSEPGQQTKPMAGGLDTLPANFATSQQDQQIYASLYDTASGRPPLPVSFSAQHELAAAIPAPHQTISGLPIGLGPDFHATDSIGNGVLSAQSRPIANSSVNRQLGGGTFIYQHHTVMDTMEGSQDLVRLQAPPDAKGASDTLRLARRPGRNPNEGVHEPGFGTCPPPGNFTGPNVRQFQPVVYGPQPGFNAGAGFYGHATATHSVYDPNFMGPLPPFNSGSVSFGFQYDSGQGNYPPASNLFPVQHAPQSGNMERYHGSGNGYHGPMPNSFGPSPSYPDIAQRSLRTMGGFEQGHHMPRVQAPLTQTTVAHQVEELDAEERALAAREDAAIRARKDALRARKRDVEELERQNDLFTPFRDSEPPRGDRHASKNRCSPRDNTKNKNGRGNRPNSSPRQGNNYQASRVSDTATSISRYGKPYRDTSNHSSCHSFGPISIGNQGTIHGDAPQNAHDNSNLEPPAIQQPILRGRSSSVPLMNHGPTTIGSHGKHKSTIPTVSKVASSNARTVSTCSTTIADSSDSIATASTAMFNPLAYFTANEETDAMEIPGSDKISPTATNNLAGSPMVAGEVKTEEFSGTNTAATIDAVASTDSSPTAHVGFVDGTVNAGASSLPSDDLLKQILAVQNIRESGFPDHKLKCAFCSNVLPDISDDYSTWCICPGCGPCIDVRYCSDVHLLADTERHYHFCGTSQVGLVDTLDSSRAPLTGRTRSYIYAPETDISAEKSKHSFELFRQMAYANIMYSKNTDKVVFEEYVRVVDKLASQVSGNDTHNSGNILMVEMDTVDYLVFSDESFAQCHKILLYVYFPGEFRVRFRRVLAAAIATYNPDLVQFIHGAVTSFIYLAGALEKREQLMTHFTSQLALEFPNVVLIPPPIIDFRVGGSGPLFDFELEFKLLEKVLGSAEGEMPELQQWLE